MDDPKENLAIDDSVDLGNEPDYAEKVFSLSLNHSEGLNDEIQLSARRDFLVLLHGLQATRPQEKQVDSVLQGIDPDMFAVLYDSYYYNTPITLFDDSDKSGLVSTSLLPYIIDSQFVGLNREFDIACAIAPVVKRTNSEGNPEYDVKQLAELMSALVAYYVFEIPSAVAVELDQLEAINQYSRIWFESAIKDTTGIDLKANPELSKSKDDSHLYWGNNLSEEINLSGFLININLEELDDDSIWENLTSNTERFNRFMQCTRTYAFPKI